MTAIDKPLREIDVDDLHRLIEEKPAEGTQFEIKKELPSKDGRPVDVATGIGDYARNNIAAEVVAFANTFGGTIVIGVDETEEKPHRPAAMAPLAACNEVAHRLRQAVFDVIDPPLPHLESPVWLRRRMVIVGLCLCG